MSGLYDATSLVFAFVVMLGVLIFVHELGHFLVAKACGVRVLKFSLGFGSPVGFGRHRLRFERGGTEYVVAWFPLGGFVKMLGENADEEESPEARSHPEEALNHKPVWQRLAIVFAGPAMNLVLPVLLFTAQLGVGMPRGAPVVGTVEPASPAAAVGLRPGDRIEAVDGEPVAWWSGVEETIRASAGQTLALRVERAGETREVDLPVAARSGIDDYGAVTELGWAGLLHPRQAPLVGIPRPETPAAAAGLRSGDLVTAVDGEPVEDWTGFARAYAAARGRATFAVERGSGEASETVRLEVPALGSLDALGVIPAAVLVKRVSPDAPAEQAGLEAGDLIVAVDGQPLGSFGALVDAVRSSEGRELQVTYAREGETRTVGIAPKRREAENVLGVPEERWLIGIESSIAALPGASRLDVERNPFVAVPRAVSMTADATGRVLTGFEKLVTGEVARDNISGPIGIAVIAHKALQAGWEIYLGMLIMISINLAILNLLPIPVLDGGQAVLFMVEGVKRGPLSLRTKEIFQQVGVTALLMLMGYAFWNDISRFWGSFVDYLTQGL
jgi:regulator of sigma E protease